jgi:hypothetical protein
MDTAEQARLRFRYTVAIINEPREVRRIRERFLEYLAPVDEVNDICDWPIPSSNGLHCRVFSFSSGIERIEEPKKIYGNLDEFRRDRDLEERDERSLLHYLGRLVA